MAKYRAPTQGNIGMTHADLGRSKTVEQMIDLTEHGCASDMISDQQFKQAMGSPERMAEFVADRIEIVSARAQYEVDKKFLNDICDLDNYRKDDTNPTDLDKSPAIFLNEEKEYKLASDKNGITNIRKLIASVKSTASVMKRVTDKFNKLKLLSSSLDIKRIGVIISDEMVGNMEDNYGNTFNAEYAKLEKTFAWVESAGIHEVKDATKRDNGKHIILVGEDGYMNSRI
ncbi:hypothetical protein BGZ65_012006 [Modicella reniformis]|uniref:Uncharacterized protein n=1 Tax=Modicella reniformis TaxID=1440133 RepID=A0A9P6LUI8_9FUNG|nr:hypothetical protein BGZ65_012006 [Modicella reniformis]